jgi:hypothetical protein
MMACRRNQAQLPSPPPPFTSWTMPVVLFASGML